MTWIRLTDLPEQRLPNRYDHSCSYWEIVDGKVVHQRRINRFADVDSFEVLDGSDFVARDKRYVYCGWSTLKSIHRDSFEPLGDGYYRDRSLGYCEFETSIRPLKGNTVEGLKVLGAGYVRDVRYAYYGGRVIAKCTSPMTFERVILPDRPSLPVARDDRHCYLEGAQLNGADPGTWVILDKGFSKDATQVFSFARRIGRVHPDNWRHLGGLYSTDGKTVYCMHFRMPDADVKSFELLPDGTARDKISAFVGRKRVAAD